MAAHLSFQKLPRLLIGFHLANSLLFALIYTILANRAPKREHPAGVMQWLVCGPRPAFFTTLNQVVQVISTAASIGACSLLLWPGNIDQPWTAEGILLAADECAIAIAVHAAFQHGLLPINKSHLWSKHAERAGRLVDAVFVACVLCTIIIAAIAHPVASHVWPIAMMGLFPVFLVSVTVIAWKIYSSKDGSSSYPTAGWWLFLAIMHTLATMVTSVCIIMLSVYVSEKKDHQQKGRIALYSGLLACSFMLNALVACWYTVHMDKHMHHRAHTNRLGGTEEHGGNGNELNLDRVFSRANALEADTASDRLGVLEEQRWKSEMKWILHY